MLKIPRKMFVFSAVVLGCGFTVGYGNGSETVRACSLLKAIGVIHASAASVLQNAPSVARPPLKAFTIRQTQTDTPVNAPPLLTETSLARRSDGSWVHSYEVLSPLGERGTVVEFLDLRSRVFVHPRPFLKSKMTSHLRESELPEYIQSAFETCDGTEKDESLQRSTMLGYPVVRRVTDMKTAIDTAWVAPELDCYRLESSTLFQSGSRVETRVTSIQEGEPPDSLFQVPPDFVERSPEEQQALYARKYPGRELFSDEQLKTIGALYRAHQ